MNRDCNQLVIGFDLDMTLIDSRRAVHAGLTALAAETGAPIDVDFVVATLGPPLEVVLGPWFAGDALVAACRRYRDLHTPYLDLTVPMPGAVEAVRAVTERGGRVIVVTSNFEPHARTSLATVGIAADAVIGWRFGAAKAEALREHGAQAYVGDHVGDVAAAKAAEVISVGVATGATTSAELRAAGADVLLPDLFALPPWLAGLEETLRERARRP